MKKILLAGICCLLTGCSGVAPEAQRDESNKLLKPPFMEKDIDKMHKNQA